MENKSETKHTKIQPTLRKKNIENKTHPVYILPLNPYTTTITTTTYLFTSFTFHPIHHHPPPLPEPSSNLTCTSHPPSTSSFLTFLIPTLRTLIPCLARHRHDLVPLASRSAFLPRLRNQGENVCHAGAPLAFVRPISTLVISGG